MQTGIHKNILNERNNILQTDFRSKQWESENTV